MYNKIDMINKKGEAIEEAIAWHTVGIAAEDGQSIGTGSAIFWRQRPLILTAGHFIDGSPDDDIWFYFRHEGTMKRSPIEELPHSRDVEYKTKIRIKTVSRYYSQKPDLAALEVERSIDREHRIPLFELPEDSATPLSGTVITMRGYPLPKHELSLGEVPHPLQCSNGAPDSGETTVRTLRSRH